MTTAVQVSAAQADTTPAAQAERFAAYEAALGDRFEATVLPDQSAYPSPILAMPHSVVTLHLVDEENQPTRRAVEEIIGFFRMRLAS